MIVERLWESAEEIVRVLRDEIQHNGTNIRENQDQIGWQYGGTVIQNSIDRLKADMKNEKGYNVSQAGGFLLLLPAYSH